MIRTLPVVHVDRGDALAGRYVPQWVESELGTVEVARLVFVAAGRRTPARPRSGRR